MLKRTPYLLAFLLGFGILAPSSLAQNTTGRQKKDAGGDEMLKKTESLTDKDSKDTKMKDSYCKVYTVKMTKGKAYKIDLNSPDFDTFLRLENSKGKEVAFNDDISQDDLNSRLIYVAPESGEFKIIATTFKGGDTGTFTLEMKLATEAEAKEAKEQSRVDTFWDQPRDEQKTLLQGITKRFKDKGADLTIEDAKLAATLVMAGDDSDPAFLREMGEGFAKIFEGASDEKIASLSKALRANLKSLDKIGKAMEVSGKTIDGKEFDLKNMKGKVVLVDFWGTWCPPCVAEIPNMVKAHEKFNKRGFEIVGITSDKNDDVVVKFSEARKLPWACINVEDSKTLIKANNINSYPTPMLIGADGRVVSLRARGPQLERLLERMLKEEK